MTRTICDHSHHGSARWVAAAIVVVVVGLVVCVVYLRGSRDLGQVPPADRLVERGGAAEHPTGGSGWGRARCGEMVCTGV